MSARRDDCDVLVVGGGHNGLVCAAYLAGAGLRVRVLERRGVVGGAAVTEEFHPGFRNSLASYTVSLLNPKVIADLRLAQHGLRVVERPYSNFLPLPDGRAFRLGGPDGAAELARWSPRDAARLPEYYAMLDRVVVVLRALMHATPPNVSDRFVLADWLNSLTVARQLKSLDMRGRRDLLDLFSKSAGELLDDWFECEPLKAALGWDSIVGNFASPYTPGSAYVLLHHVFGEVNGKSGVWGHAIGGMGAISDAIATECRARGVVIDTDADVAQVLVENGRAVGVALVDGRTLRAGVVASNLNPKLLYTRLVAPEHLDEDTTARIRRYRCGSGTFRMNVALSELPDFRAAPGTTLQPHHQSGILIGDSLGYFERAYFDAKSREHNPGWARAPVVELVISSTLDDSLAPPGQHVASLFCQHVNPVIEDADGGWDAHRDTVAQLMIDTVDAQAPNFARSVLGYDALTPFDLERRLGLIGGDIFHGALGPDQLFSARPLLGQGNYRGALGGLYLCGSGSHPGGGVTGLPGRNAAREILRDLRRGPRP
ncbi:NAD(P)/FAD-dependent oxidoreductase [Luteimonas fraxinea]|uniref:Pyridine nucleotide-disulfide oxidoreductase domain-containing protein 2 n=1 Tax=Luteimonas fraxinea TaxID=2901869 RepID=A0ABS8U7X9_9GAMM|nr:NAD(P)/FAD-dependent oxidoreductase [Luteimonas fraxinea]MCD9095721.1 NAD(P)/FAD-dependent oxidoreductase [Luteimonas fraxinea]MCD9124302.1 NAD(P)/FAD-dependent oxidoreductase [Luteimonas fraxinea]UHH11092.1 NAD(P)/FAD-dependent oxidoreductase [Luteimonas fraxinea]